MKKYLGEELKEEDAVAVAMNDARAGFPDRAGYQDVRVAAGEWLQKKGLGAISMRQQLRKAILERKRK
jgi:hypothetical protein